MRKIAAVLIMTLVGMPAAALADDGQPTTAVQRPSLRDAAMREAARHVSATQAAKQPAPKERGWASRHPVWAGTLFGLAGGAAVLLAIYPHGEGGDVPMIYYMPLFAGAGAGVGAAAGWAISLKR